MQLSSPISLSLFHCSTLPKEIFWNMFDGLKVQPSLEERALDKATKAQKITEHTEYRKRSKVRIIGSPT